jgi:hypothetical protein
VSIIKKNKKQIDDVRALLNQMVDCKDIELTDNTVVELSRELDELINEYMRNEKSKSTTS